MSQTNGRTYMIEELTDGYIVSVFDPSVQGWVRKAALTIGQVVAVLKGYGLDVIAGGVSDHLH